MSGNELKLSSYVKAATILIGLFALFILLYIAQGIIVPLIFSVIIAIVLHPVVDFFVRIKINRVFAITIIIILTIMVLTVLGTLFVAQVSRFAESWPLLVEKFTEAINNAVIWASAYFEINPEKFHGWLAQFKDESINLGVSSIGQTIVTIGGWFVMLFLIPVYVFLLLLYQPLILDFIHKLFNADQQGSLGKMISQSKTVIQGYLIGLFAEFVILAILYAGAFFILGIDYAMLLGAVVALLNVVRYIGPLIGIALVMALALITKSPAYVLYVLIFHIIIQIIDNFYIVPKIVASRVRINALFSIIAMIAGYALWGLSGMFLAIPLLAIAKLIFDNIEPLKPWGFLLGDTMPPLIHINPIIKRLKK
ncbi:MAG: AI-2E family transporter [Bacteroidales bacterium]